MYAILDIFFLLHKNLNFLGEFDYFLNTNCRITFESYKNLHYEHHFLSLYVKQFLWVLELSLSPEPKILQLVFI